VPYSNEVVVRLMPNHLPADYLQTCYRKLTGQRALSELNSARSVENGPKRSFQETNEEKDNLKMKTKVKAAYILVSTNHNQTLNHETNGEFDQSEVIEIEETELETIVATLPIRSGLKAGTIQPCL
jgi:hypothetical protein